MFAVLDACRQSGIASLCLSRIGRTVLPHLGAGIDIEVAIEIVLVDLIDEAELHDVADARPQRRPRHRLSQDRRLTRRRRGRRDVALVTLKDPHELRRPRRAIGVARLRHRDELLGQIDRAEQHLLRRHDFGGRIPVGRRRAGRLRRARKRLRHERRGDQCRAAQIFRGNSARTGPNEAALPVMVSSSCLRCAPAVRPRRSERSEQRTEPECCASLSHPRSRRSSPFAGTVKIGLETWPDGMGSVRKVHGRIERHQRDRACGRVVPGHQIARRGNQGSARLRAGKPRPEHNGAPGRVEDPDRPLAHHGVLPLRNRHSRSIIAKHLLVVERTRVACAARAAAG